MILAKDELKLKCTACGKIKDADKFYKSYSFLYKCNGDSRMSICKDCLLELYAKYLEKHRDRRKAVYEVCKKVDTCYLDTLFEAAELQVNKTQKGRKPNVCRIYFQKANSLNQYQDLTFDNSESLDYVSTEQKIKNIEESSESENLEDNVYSDIWMGTYSRADLNYLNSYLSKLQEDFKIITINHIDYAKKIAKASLAMDKAYSDLIAGVSGAEGRYKNLKDAFDSLSKSAQFSESNRGESVGVHGISQIVEKVENRQWIKSKEEFEKDQLDHLMDQFSNITKSL